MGTCDDRADIPLDELDAILLRKHGGNATCEIIFWLKDGKSLVRPIETAEECAEVWNSTAKLLTDNEFVRFYDALFRPESIEVVTRHTHEQRKFIHFRVRKGRGFFQAYADEEGLRKDLELVTEILSTAQELQAGSNRSPTMH